ncbi:MAG: DUF4364 family protein [Butyricicoccus pullicaecorum]|nr:DUF4364 family protein [Butyricicoccus pullicaecorum]
MSRYGFIKTKEDIKFLILYALCYLPEPATFEILLDVCTWCDDGFGWFEFKEAFDELVETGHLSIADPCLDTTYTISDKGHEALAAFNNRLPYTVRESAQRSALRVVRQAHRDAVILTHTEQQQAHDFLVKVGIDEVFSLELHAASAEQASLLEKTFRAHAEEIYQTILHAMTSDYDTKGN